VGAGITVQRLSPIKGVGKPNKPLTLKNREFAKMIKTEYPEMGLKPKTLEQINSVDLFTKLTKDLTLQIDEYSSDSSDHCP
jgi:hypothetical protein